MRIDAVELYRLRMDLVSPFQTSFGIQTFRDPIIVCVESEGVRGYGEVSTLPWPLYNEEATPTAWLVLTSYLIPDLLGGDFETPVEVAEKLRHWRGQAMAKAALENAFWDVYAKLHDWSLAEALHRVSVPTADLPPTPFPQRVPVGVSIGIQPTLDDLLQKVEGYLKEGYRKIKIKIQPGYELQPVQTVRQHFGAIPLMVDANSAFTLADTSRLSALDAYDLMMIEQPLAEDDLVDHAKLQRSLCTPICLDESIHHVEDARKAVGLGSCRIINVKVARVGGLTQVRKIEAFCRTHDVPLWCGGMLETGIGRAINLALTTLPGFTLPGDTSASSRYFHQDIVDSPAVLNDDGTIDVPQGPGIGVNVSIDRIEALATDHQRFEA